MSYLKISKKIELEEALRFLIDANFVNQPNHRCGNIFITDKGKKFLEKYARFNMKGKLAKFTEIFNKNFAPMISLFALTVAFISLFH